MPEDDMETNTFEASRERQNIRTIGSSLVGEDREEVNTMSDNGLTGTFVTHRQARAAIWVRPIRHVPGVDPNHGGKGHHHPPGSLGYTVLPIG